jgi:5'-3' exonuclease
MSDSNSPIIDFYPQDFDIDMDGCKFAWQGVAILPFIDEKRLLDAIEPLEAALTGSVAKRNSHGHDRLLLHSTHPGAPGALEKHDSKALDPAQSGGLHGTIRVAPETLPIGNKFPSPIKYLESIPHSMVWVLEFLNPKLLVCFVVSGCWPFTQPLSRL